MNTDRKIKFMAWDIKNQLLVPVVELKFQSDLREYLSGTIGEVTGDYNCVTGGGGFEYIQNCIVLQ